MTRPRINVLGASGCGASTLGRALASALSISFFDGDDYFHGPSDPPFRNPRPLRERFELITRDLGRDAGWVLAGGVVGWNPCPDLEFTQVVFLTVPTDVRLERLRRRESERFGPRILPGGDMHADHLEFLNWASRYDAGDVEGKTLDRHRAWLAAQTCPVLELPGELPIATIRTRVLAALA